MDWLIELLKSAGPPLASSLLETKIFVLSMRGGQLTLIVSLWVVLILGVPFLRGRAAIPARILSGITASLFGWLASAADIGLLFAADAKSVAAGLLIGLVISAAIAGFVFWTGRNSS